MHVEIIGMGKVGRALLAAAKRAGISARITSVRKGLRTSPYRADLLILTARDRDLPALASSLADRNLVTSQTACVHVAGALGAEVLAPLRAVSAGIAQMHPMIAFASLDFAPHVEGGHVHVKGDEAAEKRARAFVRKLGMTPRTFPTLDAVGYHAAAGLVANGATALAALGAELLVRSGVPREQTAHLLGPLLRSVAENVERLGFPSALTGPVRRGDRAGLERHVAALKVRLPEAIPLYLASARAQLPLARAIGDASSEAFDSLEAFLTAPDGE